MSGNTIEVCERLWAPHRSRGRVSFLAPVIGGLAVGVVALGLLPVPSQALTLEEAVRLAVETHPTVKAAEAAQRGRKEQVGQVRAPLLPVIDGRATSGYEHSDTPGTRGRATRGPPLGPLAPGATNMLHTDSQILLRQMIFDGFETKNRTDAAKTRVRVARFELRDSEELIALRAVEAYHDVIRRREIVELAEENVEAHMEVLEDVRIRARGGGGNIADVRQAEARMALSRTRLTELRGDLRDAETDYLEAVGTVPDDLSLPEPPEDLVPMTMEESVAQAVGRNPAITAASTTVEARQEDVVASRGVFWPRLDAEVSAQRNQNIGGSRGKEIIYRAFGVLRWNLFRGGGDRARTRRLKELASRAIQLEAEIRRLVEEQMRLDFNARQVSIDRLPTLEDRVLAADQVVAAYRQQFQLGQRTLLDVLDVENELFQARVALVSGEFDFRVSNYQILSTIGILVPALLGSGAEAEGATQ